MKKIKWLFWTFGCLLVLVLIVQLQKPQMIGLARPVGPVEFQDIGLPLKDKVANPILPHEPLWKNSDQAPSLEQLESHYVRFNLRDISSEIESLKREVDSKGWILKANQATLSSVERMDLALNIRKQAVLKKIWTEKQLDDLEAGL